MIADEERRQIADRLHEEAENWRDFAKDDTLFDMCDATFVESILSAFRFRDLDMHAYEAFDELAAMLDRPTCTIVDSYQLITPGLGELDLDDMMGFELSCGHEVQGYETPKYCSKCGAEVVE